MIEHTGRAEATTVASDAGNLASRLTLYAGLALCAIGFALNRMWTVLPWERLALSLALAAVSVGLAWPLRRFARWSWASSLSLVWLLALAAFVGTRQAVGTLALASAALVVGAPWLVVTVPGRLPLAITTGLALIAGLTGWILTWPVHFAWSWWALLAVLLLWQRRTLSSLVAAALRGWREAVGDSPRWAAVAVVLLGLASTACWLPTMQVDDLAYHLGLPSQMLLHGEYRPDPAHQAWSFAPWAGDTLHGITAVLADGHAHGGMSAAWLALAAAAIWSASTSMGARPAERWGAVALFASLPPVVWMAAGMQTELPATAVLAALTAVIVAPSGDGRAGRLLPGAILLGALFALKLAHVISALPLLAYAGWRHRQHLPRGWQPFAVALLVVVVAGGSSYLQSWWHTGNPVLPMFNAFFQSPFFPVDSNYRDDRWFTGFGAAIPWSIAFDTDRYVEAWDGGIGFSVVALSGAWLVALSRQPTRGLAGALALAFLLPLVPLQYARYAYPGLLLLVLAQVPFGEARFGRRQFHGILLALCVVNLAFQANASWLHHSGALKRTIRAGGDAAAIYPHYVPERVLLQRIPAGDEGLVLATNPGRGYIAELGGRGRAMLDHDPTLRAARERAEADPSGASWAQLFVTHRIRWVLVTPDSASPALQAGVRHSGQRVAVLGDAELWRMNDARPAP